MAVVTAREGIDTGAGSVLLDMCDGDPANLSGEMISKAAQGGDEYSRKVIRETGEWIGVGVASLVNLLNPEMVVLSGGMIGADYSNFATLSIRSCSIGITGTSQE